LDGVCFGLGRTGGAFAGVSIVFETFSVVGLAPAELAMRAPDRGPESNAAPATMAAPAITAQMMNSINRCDSWDAAALVPELSAAPNVGSREIALGHSPLAGVNEDDGSSISSWGVKGAPGSGVGDNSPMAFNPDAPEGVTYGTVFGKGLGVARGGKISAVDSGEGAGEASDCAPIDGS